MFQKSFSLKESWVYIQCLLISLTAFWQRLIFFATFDDKRFNLIMLRYFEPFKSFKCLSRITNSANSHRPLRATTMLLRRAVASTLHGPPWIKTIFLRFLIISTSHVQLRTVMILPRLLVPQDPHQFCTINWILLQFQITSMSHKLSRQSMIIPSLAAFQTTFAFCHLFQIFTAYHLPSISIFQHILWTIANAPWMITAIHHIR